MEAKVIDGRAIARQLQEELVGRIAALKARGLRPGLAFVRVGEDPASKVYVGRKEKVCAELGLFSETHVLAQAATEAEVLAFLARLNAEARLHGILVQAQAEGDFGNADVTPDRAASEAAVGRLAALFRV